MVRHSKNNPFCLRVGRRELSYLVFGPESLDCFTVRAVIIIIIRRRGLCLLIRIEVICRGAPSPVSHGFVSAWN